MRKSRSSRIAASLATAVLLTTALPLTASAEVENIWSRWTSEVLDRDAKWEIPFAVIGSIPAMVLITPIWAGQLALQAIDGDE